MKNALLFLIIGMLYTSCKKAEELKTEELPIPEKGIEFKVNLKTNTNDDFRLLLNNINEANKKINIHVSKSLESQKNSQAIDIKIQEDFFPQELIIDLGPKPSKIIDVESIYIKTSTFELNIPKHKVNHFFYFNTFVAFDSVNQQYKTLDENKSHLLIFRNRVMDSLWLHK